VITEWCEDAARSKGLAAGLDTALSDIDVARAAFGSVVAVPAGIPAVAQVPHPLAEAEGIIFVRVAPGGDTRAAVTVAGRLARARIGLSASALAAAAQLLQDRSAGGEPIARKQLVVGDIAECSLDIDIVRQQADLVAASTDLAAAADLHGRIDELDWRIARLFGASGYVTGGSAAQPHGTALYVSALVAHCWVARTELRPWS
jgi:hypothetical protein